MGYLQPPPMPAPVIVMKDVGGFVADYQTQTALYRASDREVRLHECRSACTLALGLPNVCVYPDSILKFHQAYDPRNHQTDFNVSQQLFDSYPAAVRARLGGLTREYKVLRGSELIGLGIRPCSEPRVMVASATPRRTAALSAAAQQLVEPQPTEQAPVLGGLLRNVMSSLGAFAAKPGEGGEQSALVRQSPAPRSAPVQAVADIPLPPVRPADLGPPAAATPQPETIEASAKSVPAAPAPEFMAAAGESLKASIDNVRISEAAPSVRPVALSYSYGHQQQPYRLPEIITGSKPILPPGFRAYADLRR